MAVNLRRHFQLPLPDDYIGNAVRFALVVYHRSGDDLCFGSDIGTGSLAGLPSVLYEQEFLYLANIAFRISAVVKSTSDEHIQCLIFSLNDQSNRNDTRTKVQISGCLAGDIYRFTIWTSAQEWERLILSSLHPVWLTVRASSCRLARKVERILEQRRGMCVLR